MDFKAAEETKGAGAQECGGRGEKGFPGGADGKYTAPFRRHRKFALPENEQNSGFSAGIKVPALQGCEIAAIILPQ